jgi:phosphate-selective porin OprO/OprP
LLGGNWLKFAEFSVDTNGVECTGPFADPFSGGLSLNCRANQIDWRHASQRRFLAMSRLRGQAFRLLLAPVVLTLGTVATPSSRGQAPAAPQAASTPADLEQRVRELEETIGRMQADAHRTSSAPQPAAAVLPPSAPQAPASTGVPGAAAPDGAANGMSLGSDQPDKEAHGSAWPLLAGWDDGFYIKSRDNNFVLRITGQIQTDYRAFQDESDRTDIDTFLLRRARFGLEATLAQYYEFRFLPDFGQGMAVVQDCYMNIHYWDEFQFEVGKFKQPFSYEQLIQDRFVPTVERSMMDQIVPARDEGIMIHGQNLWDKRFDYAVSISNGEINGNSDTNDQKDFVGRVALRPFAPSDLLALRWLQVGVSGSYGIEDEPVSPSTLKTPATVPWFTYLPTVRASGLRSRVSPEVSYFYRSLGLAAQYIRMEQELRPAAVPPAYKILENVPTEGFYVMATYLLTGEERTTYSAPVKPLHPFDPCHPCACAGAWELVARLDRLEVANEVFQPGLGRLADPTKSSAGATETTLGFNWYLNEWVRMQFNWEHAWFDNPVALGVPPNPLLKSQDSFLTRFQIIF